MPPWLQNAGVAADGAQREKGLGVNVAMDRTVDRTVDRSMWKAASTGCGRQLLLLLLVLLLLITTTAAGNTTTISTIQNTTSTTTHRCAGALHLSPGQRLRCWTRQPAGLPLWHSRVHCASRWCSLDGVYRSRDREALVLERGYQGGLAPGHLAPASSSHTSSVSHAGLATPAQSGCAALGNGAWGHLHA